MLAAWPHPGAYGTRRNRSRFRGFLRWSTAHPTKRTGYETNAATSRQHYFRVRGRMRETAARSPTVGSPGQIKSGFSATSGSTWTMKASPVCPLLLSRSYAARAWGEWQGRRCILISSVVCYGVLREWQSVTLAIISHILQATRLLERGEATNPHRRCARRRREDQRQRRQGARASCSGRWMRCPCRRRLQFSGSSWTWGPS